MTGQVPPTWLVGHDGSEAAGRAARWAIGLAADRGVAIRLVRTWQIPSTFAPLPVGPVDRFAPRHACDDIEELSSIATSRGIDFSESIVRGPATPALLESSETGELLILGSRGLGGFRRLLLGSVSSQCATHARVPTVVVPPTSVTDRSLRRIVVGLDGSERSRRALAWARDFAPEGCAIRVVGAWMPSRSGYVAVVQHYTMEIDAVREHYNEILDDLEAEAGSTLFERHFAFKDPATTLLDSLDDADLLVVGQRGHSGLSAAVLGSVTTHVLHHSPIPVAVVPADD